MQGGACWKLYPELLWLALKKETLYFCFYFYDNTKEGVCSGEQVHTGPRYYQWSRIVQFCLLYPIHILTPTQVLRPLGALSPSPACSQAISHPKTPF